MSEANGTLGFRHQEGPSLKATNNVLLVFSEHYFLSLPRDPRVREASMGICEATMTIRAAELPNRDARTLIRVTHVRI